MAQCKAADQFATSRPGLISISRQQVVDGLMDAGVRCHSGFGVIDGVEGKPGRCPAIRSDSDHQEGKQAGDPRTATKAMPGTTCLSPLQHIDRNQHIRNQYIGRSIRRAFLIATRYQRIRPDR